MRHGIQTAFQEMTLVRDLTVLDNMLLPYAPQWPQRHDPPQGGAEPRSSSISTRSAFGVDLDAEVGGLDLPLQQKIEIARAHLPQAAASCCSTSRPPRSPAATSTGWASSSPVSRPTGMTIVFISHRMREVRAFCDTLTVLRNGQHIATGRVARNFRRRGDRE